MMNRSLTLLAGAAAVATTLAASTAHADSSKGQLASATKSETAAGAAHVDAAKGQFGSAAGKEMLPSPGAPVLPDSALPSPKVGVVPPVDGKLGDDRTGIGEAGDGRKGALEDLDKAARIMEEQPRDLIEGSSGAYVDEAMGAIPEEPGFFKKRDAGPPELGALEPGSHVQPGGPNDPAAGDNGVPSFVPGDPRNPDSNGRDQGPRNPSNTIDDPRGTASDGGTGYYHTETRGRTTYTWARNNGRRSTTKTRQNEDGTATVDRLEVRRDGSRTYSHTEVARDESSVRHDYLPNGTEVITHIRPDGTVEQTWTIERNSDDEPDGGDPAGNPNPVEPDEIDISECGRTIPMWVCTRGSGGSATPDEMLTQPGRGEQPPGSIVASGASGPDFGREAVTNTGDGSFDTTRSRGGGGGSGGVPDWQRPGDPDPDR